MLVHFMGGVRTVTGACFRITSGASSVLLDCGLFQGPKALEERNRRVHLYEPHRIEAVILSHAHMDHAGLLPALVQKGYRGPIYCTPATRDLCEILLFDGAHIQEMEAEWRTRKNLRKGLPPQEPLYTRGDVEKTLRLFSPIPYGQRKEVAHGIYIRFQDAGHILGSAEVELWAVEDGGTTKLVFSGDLGRKHQPLIRDPQTIEDADVLLVESTYGDRDHKSQEETIQEFKDILDQVIRDEEKMIVPSFAVGRTQEVLYILHEFYRRGDLPTIPIYVDSPLATAATEIFRRHPECFDGLARALLKAQDEPLKLPGLRFTRTVEESRSINDLRGPAIIIAASGMASAGRILHHLKHNLWRQKAHIVFIGFQAQGSLGRMIIDGAKSVNIFGETVAVKAKIHTLGGFSAHADRSELLDWVGHFKTKGMKVFVVHGEEHSAVSLARALREAGFADVEVPTLLERVEIGAPGEKTPTLPVQPKTAPEIIWEAERRLKRLRKRLSRKRPGPEELSTLTARLLDLQNLLLQLESPESPPQGPSTVEAE